MRASDVADVETALRRLGGVGDAAALVGVTSARAVRRAVGEGVIVRDSRGRYAIPTADVAQRTANRLHAVVSHTSAAAYWGWETKDTPPKPTVTVPRNRNVSAAVREEVGVYWRDLDDADVVPANVTVPLRTVLDVACSFPLDEALTVADSALRHGSVTYEQLHEAAGRVQGRGRAKVRQVLAEANHRAANSFESVLRAISVDMPGLRLEPQVEIRLQHTTVRPDLVDQQRRIVAEADSFEFHGRRPALVRDCARYDNLVADGWVVLRFAWEQVMFRPRWVARCLTSVATRQTRLLGVSIS